MQESKPVVTSQPQHGRLLGDSKQESKVVKSSREQLAAQQSDACPSVQCPDDFTVIQVRMCTADFERFKCLTGTNDPLVCHTYCTQLQLTAAVTAPAPCGSPGESILCTGSLHFPIELVYGSLAPFPPLGTAGTFAALGASTVTNTGFTVLNGDLGLYPGTSVAGFPPGVVNGSTHVADTAAGQAQTDASAAYSTLLAQSCTSNLTGFDLGGMTLNPGVYCFDMSAALTGVLTLDAQGDPTAKFIFQIGTTLTTAANSLVTLVNRVHRRRLGLERGLSGQ
jgi:hypothetical protein